MCWPAWVSLAPASRGPGMILTMLPNLVLALGAIVGAVLTLLG